MQITLHDSLLNSVPFAILAIDSQGNVLELNRAARELLPSTVPEPVGQSIVNLFPEWISLLEKVKDDLKQRWQTETRLTNNQVAEVSISPMPGYGWSITIHEVRPLTDSK